MDGNMETSPSQRRQALEREIAGLRSEIGVVVHEVERRARQAVDVRRQAARHPYAAFGALAVLTGAVVLAVAYPIYKRRRRARFSRLRNLRLALAHLMMHPEDVMHSHRSPGGERLLGAGKAIGGMGLKRILRRYVLG